MPNLLRRPTLFCWGLAIVCGLLALLLHDRTPDIQLYDTYLVLNEIFLLQVCLLFCLVGVLVYSLLLRFGYRPEPILTSLHLALTAIGCIYLLTFPEPERPKFSTMELTNQIAYHSLWFFLLALAPVAGFLLLLVNGLICLLFRRKEN
ncbi:hypothetical protein [Siphonobacter aquaeclarae]|uniref:Cytochrome C and Quinol oxidase polypeptide I n=1 Tax=Siphonobacter aquaeclarae TaxID=563176 RepID=A0A1G9IPK5_9BACT|nr:hypothetical protein [Siphonobacter aquaeclarae]SDL26844.1 hypothetical protein SAMN04488090_0559 [Siphonobacter aquaeclarae]